MSAIYVQQEEDMLLYLISGVTEYYSTKRKQNPIIQIDMRILKNNVNYPLFLLSIECRVNNIYTVFTNICFSLTHVRFSKCSYYIHTNSNNKSNKLGVIHLFI